MEKKSVETLCPVGAGRVRRVVSNVEAMVLEENRLKGEKATKENRKRGDVLEVTPGRISGGHYAIDDRELFVL